jgi:hypothetical protein
LPSFQPARRRAATPDPVAERLWVEELAMLFATHTPGFPRTAGRILGWMLISSAATVTQADLADALALSQASVSPALRHLIESGYLEKTRTPGVRADQYRLREQSWQTTIRTAALAVESLIRHVDRGLELPGPDLSPGRAQLAELSAYYRRFQALLLAAAEPAQDER